MGTFPFHPSVPASHEHAPEALCEQGLLPRAAKSCTDSRAACEEHLESMATSVLSCFIQHNPLSWHFTLSGTIKASNGVDVI